MSIIGAFVRNAAMKYGIDGFSCNLVFGITTTILMVIYVHVSDGINRWRRHQNRRCYFRVCGRHVSNIL